MKITNRPLAIYKYLCDSTDEEHPATIVEIMDHLATLGVEANRKTVANDCRQLQECGYDVVCTRSRQNRYFIGSREMELPELKMLVDAVLAAQFIPADKSRTLVEKLAELAGPYQAEALERELYMDSRVKTTNRAVYYTVDMLYTAIRERKKIRFTYRSYEPGKGKTLKHNGQVYSFSPYNMAWSGDRYYVFGYSDNHQRVVSFRVDRMVGPEITEEAAVEKPAEYDITDFFREVFMMYNGERATVTLLCENRLMKDIVDRFGEDVTVSALGDNHFTLDVDVACSPTFFAWVFTYEGGIQILRPEKAVQAYREQLLKVTEKLGKRGIKGP